MIVLYEHFGLFLLLTLLACLVYSGLRQDDLRVVVRLALRRFLFFVVAAAVFGAATFAFARML